MFYLLNDEILDIQRSFFVMSIVVQATPSFTLSIHSNHFFYFIDFYVLKERRSSMSLIMIEQLETQEEVSLNDTMLGLAHPHSAAQTLDDADLTENDDGSELGNALSLYLCDMGRIPRLNAKEEIRLALMIQQGKLEQQRAIQDGTLPNENVMERAKDAQRRLIEANLHQELGRKPTVEEIAQQIGSNEEQIREILKANQQPISLETPVGEDNDEELGDLLEDQLLQSPMEITAHYQLQEYITHALQGLSERERDILQLRYGLLDGTSHSLTEIGEIIHVSRERVRQIEIKALQKLRVKSSDQLKDFLN
jgi:DNA-directed RNA polymerase sigma subunit (sigma70/sigma32)